MKRLPRTYLGVNHQTLGSDILSVLNALTLPERTLGPELTQRLKQVKADQWYPIDLLLESFEKLQERADPFALKNVGYRIFSMSHAENVRGSVHSARQLLHGFDDIYKHVNRGVSIGGWKVTKFEPGYAQMEKTTPHHCVVEEGILEEALRTIGVPAQVSQSQCFRKGAELCVYEIKSAVADQRWNG